MGEVRLKFDGTVLSDELVKEMSKVLQARCVSVVKVPTHSEEREGGLISKTELLPRIIMAGTLTAVQEGGCLTSILNMNDKEFSVSLCIVEPEECKIETNTIQVDTLVAQGAVTREVTRVAEEN
jgi:hypothetical protein